jgi:UDP:flavonoid glycosyltransferase YjiC (YdhE family)
MSVMLSKHGSRGDIEPMAGLAVRLRTLGAEVRVCAPRFCCLTVQRIACPAITRQ